MLVLNPAEAVTTAPAPSSLQTSIPALGTTPATRRELARRTHHSTSTFALEDILRTRMSPPTALVGTPITTMFAAPQVSATIAGARITKTSTSPAAATAHVAVTVIQSVYGVRSSSFEPESDGLQGALAFAPLSASPLATTLFVGVLLEASAHC